MRILLENSRVVQHILKCSVWCGVVCVYVGVCVFHVVESGQQLTVI